MPALTREVQVVAERLSAQFGVVAVDQGYADGLVRLTVPNGMEFKVSEDGISTRSGLNFSVDWGAL